MLWGNTKHQYINQSISTIWIVIALFLYLLL
jgi:hypothetical protein